MRKHNKTFATRWSRASTDRSNFPQTMAHDFVKNKQNQLYANVLLCGLLNRVGAFKTSKVSA